MNTPISGNFSRAFRAFLSPIRKKRTPDPAMPIGEGPHPWEAYYPEGIDWDVQFESKSLVRLFDDAIARYGERPCIKFRGRSFPYKEVGELVERVARGFRALGVDRGIKVALMLPNSPYTVICYYAVLKAGGRVVNINPLYASPEIAHLINDSGACILVTLDLKSLYRKIEPLLAEENRLEKVVVCSVAGVLPFTEKALCP